MGKKLFVGGLSWNTNSEQLKAAFAAIGPVIDAVVISDRETGRSRGFGFVTYQNDADADRAMSDLSGSVLDGRVIKIDAATERAPGGFGGGGPRRGPPGPGGPPPSYGGGPPRGGGGGGGFGGGGGPPGAGGGGGGGGGRGGGGGGADRRGRPGPDRDRRDREGQRSKRKDDDPGKGGDYLDDEY